MGSKQEKNNKIEKIPKVLISGKVIKVEVVSMQKMMLNR